MLARHRATGFPATIVRPAAIYGPDNNIFDMELPMFLRLLGHRPIVVPHGGLVVGSYGHVGDLPGSVFGHLFGMRHHAMLSIEKAKQLLGFTFRYDLRSGHQDTYEWFQRQGYAE